MKQFLILGLILFSSIGWAAPTVTNGGDHGNGGDALRSLFIKAREAAIHLVNDLQWCSFESNIKQEKAEWILNKRHNIALDIAASQYYWVIDDQPTCGYTERTHGAPIYLSYLTCASTVGTSLSNAIFVVLHETAHHFGIDNEDEADQFAESIMRADAHADCHKPVEDVFNSRICTGLPFSKQDGIRVLAGNDKALLAKYNFYGRYRDCIKGGPCDSWTTDIVNYTYPIKNPGSPSSSQYTYPAGKFELYLKRELEYPGFSWLASVGPVLSGTTVGFDFIQNQFDYEIGSRYKSYLELHSMSPKFIQYTGGINTSCGWFKSSVRSAGTKQYYREGELVIYGTH